MTCPQATGTVPRLLELRVAESPQAVAFRREVGDGNWQAVNWQDFALQVHQLRRALWAAGLRKGDRLALIAPVSLEWELLHQAGLAMGAVIVGLDAHDLPARISDMCDQADIAAFATADPRVLSKVATELLNRAHFVLDLSGTNDLPTEARRLTWPELNAQGDSSGVDPPPPIAEDIATIVFTSGTTGRPKGIAYTHRQVSLAIDAIGDAFSFVNANSRLLCWLPLSNLFQRMVNLAGMRNGAASYLLGDPRRVMEVVATVSPDIFVGVPRFYEKLYGGIRDRITAMPRLRRGLVEFAWDISRRASRYRLDGRRVPPWLALIHGISDRTILARIRSVMGDRLCCMISGSAPTPRHLLEEFHALGWLVLEAYGMSENVLPMAMNRRDDFRFGTVGRPLPGNQIMIGEDGAIKVRGPGMFTGYLGEESSPPFDSNGFYCTGDLGQFDANNYLRLTGRNSELIKTSTGRRIAPASVEAHLRRVPGIDQVVLIGAGRKCLIALCSCSCDNLSANAKARLEVALREHVGGIGEHERPSAIALIAGLFSIERGELTPNLKVRRDVIEAQYGALIERIYQELGRAGNSVERDLVILQDFSPRTNAVTDPAREKV